MPKTKKPRGRPARPMPERIDASPEQLAKAMFALPKDYKWKYLEDKKEGPNDNPN